MSDDRKGSKSEKRQRNAAPVLVRLNDPERALLQTLADDDGVAPTTYLRLMTFADADKAVQHSEHVQAKDIQSLSDEFNQYAAHLIDLNRLVKDANTHGLDNGICHDLLSVLEQIKQPIIHLRLSWLQTLDGIKKSKSFSIPEASKRRKPLGLKKDTPTKYTREGKIAKSERRQRNKYLLLRLNDVERHQINVLSAHAGLSPPAYIRWKCLGSPGAGSGHQKQAHEKDMARFIGQLGKLGGNLTQVFNLLQEHGHALKPEIKRALLKEVQDIKTPISDMRAAWLSILGR